eukprot:TRINITY_DN10774_c0_g1_i1.p1 TRINITY_DN10774_c0_g1~~TRINITY_DN10774_c0_g1_i1.p1  ORF type:complete len:154 (+),score=39.93 TRINITY_DN10774_c0_g1_i1:31-462(+)
MTSSSPIFDDTEDQDKLIAQREWDRMQNTFKSEGYKEGSTLGKENEAVLQSGFNEGFEQGSQLSKDWGYLLGIVSTWESLLKNADNTKLSKEFLDYISRLQRFEKEILDLKQQIESQKEYVNKTEEWQSIQAKVTNIRNLTKL